MSILHIIGLKPSQKDQLHSLASLIAANDFLVFVDEGAYSAADLDVITALTGEHKQLRLAVIAEDLNCRGLDTCSPEIALCPMSALVELCFDADKTLSWY